MRVLFARTTLPRLSSRSFSVSWATLRVRSISFLVAAAGILGLMYALLMPPLSVPDETSHFFRAYRLTQGHFVPEDHALVPQNVVALAHVFDLETTQQRDRYIPNLMHSLREGPADSSPLVDADGYRTTDFYDSLTYIPPAIGIGIGRLLRGPAVVLMYAGRFSNLAFFLALAAFALRMLRNFRVAFASVLLLPMTLHQAASNSADAYAIGMAFLYLALVLRFAYRGPDAVLRRKDIIGLLAAAFLLGIAKADFVLVGAVLLIRPRSTGEWKGYAALFFGSVACATLPLFLWNVFAAAPIATLDRNLIQMGLSDPSVNLKLLEQHPWLCVTGMGVAAYSQGSHWIETAIGRFGPLVVFLPTWVIDLNVAVLLFIGLSEVAPKRFGWPDRAIGYSVCFAYTLAVMTAAYVALTSLFEIAVHTTYGHGEFGGMQGRYLLPALPLAISLLCTKWFVVKPYVRAIVLAACVSITTVAAYQSIFNFYIANSLFGPPPLPHPLSFYEGKFVMVAAADANPGDAGAVYYIHNGSRYWVVYGDWLPRHGFPTSPKILTVSAREAESFHWMGASKVINEPDWQLDPSPAAARYDDRIISQSGSLDGPVYMVGHGVKKIIVEKQWLQEQHFAPTRVTARELRAIPDGDPVQGYDALDGTLIRLAPNSRIHDDRVFVIQGGKKHWVLPAYLHSHGLSLESARPIDATLFGRIVEGPPYYQ